MFYICTVIRFGNENKYKIQIQFYEEDKHHAHDDVLLYAFIYEF